MPQWQAFDKSEMQSLFQGFVVRNNGEWVAGGQLHN